MFVYSKARHGTVTRILLNLCLSLTILLIVLYIAEQFADTRLGCRVANVLRYYLVLVSLFWNGIEAHNMYRMLVKVFNTAEQSHFVLKAALVAWGLLVQPVYTIDLCSTLCIPVVVVANAVHRHHIPRQDLAL